MSLSSKLPLFVGCVVFGIMLEIAHNVSALPAKIVFSTMAGLVFIASIAVLTRTAPLRWNLRCGKAIALVAACTVFFGIVWTFGGSLSAWSMRVLIRGIAGGILGLAITLLPKTTADTHGTNA